MRFLGIDLGWTSQPSGLCCLEWQPGELRLLSLERRSDIAEVLTWIDYWVPVSQPAGIAVDAPTLIPNATGMRLPDRLAHQHFGRYHAGCYPANLGRPFAQRTVSFGLSLEDRGFGHAPVIAPQQPSRFQIEVFPHPAIVRLFKLERILKYKKGLIADRRTELAKLHHFIQTTMPHLDPALTLDQPAWSNLHHLIPLPAIPQTGVALKAVEDQLDSLICAYVAAHWWCWGLMRNQVLGDREQGYIVVPDPG